MEHDGRGDEVGREVDHPVGHPGAPGAGARRALYFDPIDAAALAEQLVAAYETCSPGPDSVLEAAARDALPRRSTREYAESFVTIAREPVRGE